MGRRRKYQSVLMSILAVLLVLDPFLGIAKVLAYEKDPPISVPTSIQEPGLDVSFTQKSDSPIELEEYRTANSKRILKPDGTITEEVYGKPIHFKDKSTNKWVSIDSALVEENGKYKNKSNRFSVNLPKDVKGQLDFSYEGTSVSFIPIFPNSVIGKVIENKLDFTGVSVDTNLNYDVLPDGLKESIILKSPKAPLKYTYELKTENLTYQLNTDGSLDFFKNGETKALLKLQKPYLEDAELKFKEATYVIRKDPSGKTFVDVEVDSTWINDPSRAFPVVLDPSIFIQDYNKVDNTYIVEGADSPHYYYSHLYVGKDSDLGRTRTLLWFDLPSIPTGAKIVNAELRVCNSRTWVPSQKPVVEARRITSYWDYSTVKWSNQPSIGQVDGTYQADTAYTWGFPVLGLVQDWYNGQQKNYGIELKYADENLILRELISNYNATIETPCLKFDYVVDGLGSQPFWTFDGPVNMANRNLVYSASDIGFAGRNVTLSLSRTYNSRSTQIGKFGYGWSSTLDMLLSISTGGPSRLIEGDGSVHYFAFSRDGYHLSPPGLFWTLEIATNGYVTTSDGTKYTFDGSTGRIKEITDASGNKITYVYEGTILRTIKDSANYAITLTYNANGLVDTACDPAGRTWKYGYDSGKNLISITGPDGKVTKYAYDSNHNLISATSPKGSTGYITYTADDRVSAINSINAVTNGNLEVDSDGNGLPDHFTYSSGQDGQGSIDSDGQLGKSFKISTSSANPSNFTVYVSDPIPVSTSKTYTLSGYVKGSQTSGTQTTVISFLAYDGSYNYLGEVGRIAQTGTFSWKRVSSTISSGSFPTGTKYVYIKLGTNNSSGTGSSKFDGIQLEEGYAASSFVCGSQYTVNASGTQSARYDGDGHKHLYTMNSSQNITKYQQDPEGLNLTESYTWDTTIPNTMTSYTNQEGKMWKYAYEPQKGNIIKITDPQNKTQSFSWDGKSNLISYIGKKGENYKYSYDGNDNLTGQDPNYTSQAKEYNDLKNLEKETNSLGLAANEIKNSSLETWVSGLPQYFYHNSGQSNTWSETTGEKVFGFKSLKLTASSSNTNNYTVMHTDGIVLNKNADYVLSGYLKNQTTSGEHSTVLSILACDSSWNVIGEVGKMNLKKTANWQRWSTVVKPGDFPTGTNGIRVKLGATSTNGSGTSYFDAIQLQEHPVDTAYNLVDNSNFERGSDWPYFWNKATSGTSQWAPGYFGVGGVSITNATTWTGVKYQSYFPYDSNKDYAFTAFAKTENLSAKVAHIKIELYDANKNLISFSGLTSEMLQGNTDWHRLSVQLSKNQAPTNTVYIRPVLMTGNATGKVFFDNVRFQEGRITTDYGYESTNTWVNKVTDPLGYVTTYDIAPGSGNVNKKIAPNGDVTEYTYDSMDRVLTTKPPGNDLLISYGYDDNGNSTKVTLTNPGQTVTYGQTTYTYNGLDLLESVINPLNGTTSYAYTPAGSLMQITTPKNDKISFKYDGVGRNTQIDLNGVKQYTYGYDVKGNLLSAKDELLNLTWSATYNDLNLLTSWKDSSLGTINYTLDESGNVTTKKLNNLSGTTLKTESVTYNTINQPSTLTDANSKVSKFLFNENGMISRIYSGNEIISNYSYDTGNRISEVRNQKNSGEILSSFQYGFDVNKSNRITSIKDQTGKTLDFTYTTKGQLYTEELPNGNTATYTYNELGNRTKRVEKKPDGTLVKETNYNYTNNKFQISSIDGKAWSYENGGSGNVTCDGKYDYTWDASNRITVIKDTVTKAVKATYKYDNQGRRIEQTVNGQVTKFLYDGKSNKVVSEFDGTGTLMKYYTWSPMGMLLSLTKRNTDNSETTYYTVRNGHGDVVQLTDKDGNIVASYTYDAWGNILEIGGNPEIGKLNPYRYAGYRYDDTTKLYYLINRYYDADLGRFLSVDPVSEIPDYTYAANNPLSYVDPDGLWLADLFWTLVDAITCVFAPTAANFGWLAVDLGTFADPSGAASTGIHLGRLANGVNKAKKYVKNLGKILPKPKKKVYSGYTNRFNLDLQYFASNKAAKTDFVVTPKGEAIPIPQGASGPVDVINKSGKTTGFAFTGGKGGANGQVDTVRIMDSTPPRGKSPGYPNGYVKYENAGQQGVNPYTGKTIPNSQSHFPLQ